MRICGNTFRLTKRLIDDGARPRRVDSCVTDQSALSSAVTSRHCRILGIDMGAMVSSALMGKPSHPSTYRSRRKAASFAGWLDNMMTAADIKDADLARAFDKLEDLRSKREGYDRRRERRKDPKQKSPSKQDIGKWRRGAINRRTGKPFIPGEVAAYRLGRALETLGCPCSGLDALIAADCWPEALGCVGQYHHDYYDNSEADDEENAVLRDMFNNRLHRKALPEAMYPALDRAWKSWLTYRSDPRRFHRFHPRIVAAFVLAKTGDDVMRAVAEQIVRRWEPIPFFYVTRTSEESEQSEET
jgi:hypothetical protein